MTIIRTRSMTMTMSMAIFNINNLTITTIISVNLPLFTTITKLSKRVLLAGVKSLALEVPESGDQGNML